MPVFSYEAHNKEGVTLRGTVEAQNRDELAAKLETMGYIPLRIQPVKQRLKTVYFVAKDAEGKTREGRIEAAGFEQALSDLKANQFREIRISTSKNMDYRFDDTLADRFAKGAAKILFLVILASTFIFLRFFPAFLMAHYLQASNSQVATARVTRTEANRIEYSFEANGTQYTGWARTPKSQAESVESRVTVPVRHSIRYPFINRLGNQAVPADLRPSRVAPIAALIGIVAVVLLWYASAFRYIARIRSARSSGLPAPPGDVRRLLTNSACALLLPLITGCIIGSLMARDPVSFYHPWQFHLAALSVVFAAAAFYLWRKGPIYYD